MYHGCDRHGQLVAGRHLKAHPSVIFGLPDFLAAAWHTSSGGGP